tara:strand:- start:95 stop:832 length:738 start_codon:yes stop_codon:yes gene_type:complete
MFDIDLMNKTGLQKFISKAKIDHKKEKNDLIFGDLESNNIKDSHVAKNENTNSNKPSFLSMLIASLILSGFIIFGIFKFKDDFYSSNFVYEFPSFITSSETSNLDIAKSLIINFISNPDKINYLNSINIDENLTLKVKVNEISDLNLKQRELQFLQIIENEDSYNALFNVPLNHKVSNVDLDILLLELLDEYENRLDVFLRADGESIYFTSSGKIIYDILDRLIFIDNITIIKNSNKFFTLRFPY